MPPHVGKVKKVHMRRQRGSSFKKRAPAGRCLLHRLAMGRQWAAGVDSDP